MDERGARAAEREAARDVRAAEREMLSDERAAIPPLPPPATSPGWLDRLDLPFVLVLALLAWSFGGYVNTNWVIQAQGERVTAQSQRITEMQRQINQNVQWLRQIQDEQKIRDEKTAALLASMNLQLAEIKGVAQKGIRK